MRTLRLPAGASPRDRGRAQGETFRREIHELAALRTELVIAEGKLRDEAQVLALSRAHLPVIDAFDRALSEELLGIADGAGIDPASVVVLNHYTDLKDLGPEALDDLGPEALEEVRRPAEDEDCSAVVARTPSGVVLGQTWDMHGSASPFVAMLHVPAHQDRPEAWLISLTGCLGMAGMNGTGVGVTINNLRSNDARVGIVWTALVRRMLAETSAEGARDVLMRAPMSSGHHYLVADRRRAFGVETSGVLKSVVFEADWLTPPDGTAPAAGQGAYLHTNHCVGETVGAVSSIGPGSTTLERYAWLTREIETRPLADAMDLFGRLGSHEGYPRSVCTHLASEATPHAMATCAGIVMDLSARRAWAAPGCIHGITPQELVFGD